MTVIPSLLSNKFGQNNKLDILIDGQFGSTGKGLFASWMAIYGPKYDVAMSSASPNSGHTAIVNGRKIVTHHLPILGVINKIPIYLTAASVINKELLIREIDENGLDRDMVTIHPCATVISDTNKTDDEKQSKLIASTMQGVGPARANKIMRRSTPIGSMTTSSIKNKLDGINIDDVHYLSYCGDTDEKRAWIEIPQGYSLSLNHSGFYPYTTSRDCTVSQALADANIHPKFLGGVVMTVRSYPIRVGNVYENGKLIGYSGPYYDDQKEISWAEINVEPEYTTVTKRKRRVFTWSNTQFEESIRAIRPDVIFTNFLNYLSKYQEAELFKKIETICLDELKFLPLLMSGRGPTSDDVERWVVRK